MATRSTPVGIEEYQTVAANQIDAAAARLAAEKEHKLSLLRSQR